MFVPHLLSVPAEIDLFLPEIKKKKSSLDYLYDVCVMFLSSAELSEQNVPM